MKPNITLAAVSIALTAVFTSPALAADATKPATAETPSADAILRQMSSKLGAARTFSFEATREIDPALLAGRKLPENAHLVVTVERPNKLAAASASQDGVRHFYADGRNLSLVDVTKNLYATVPMPTSIDGLVAEIDRKYGFTPPLAEIALSNVYQDIHQKAQNVSYLGQGNYSGESSGLGGVACHRLALSGKLVDAELWVGVNDQLPRRLIVTVKNRPGNPHLKVEFSHWNLSARVTDQDFVFVPPKGALKIPMITTAEAAAAQKKH
jgi:hypothetical protein